MIILSPLLLIIAIAIKIDSKGPVIYKSKRV
ncbi:sugar transferase [bacterium]|nr:sugar transferase [bacterium]